MSQLDFNRFAPQYTHKSNISCAELILLHFLAHPTTVMSARLALAVTHTHSLLVSASSLFQLRIFQNLIENLRPSIRTKRWHFNPAALGSFASRPTAGNDLLAQLRSGHNRNLNIICTDTIRAGWPCLLPKHVYQQRHQGTRYKWKIRKIHLANEFI